MIGRIIAASARNPLIVILLILGIGSWGYLSLRRAPRDAVPDLCDAQVIVFTQWMGRSPDLVENQVTYPISSALVSAPGVKFVRGQSMFGMSFVYVVFVELGGGKLAPRDVTIGAEAGDRVEITSGLADGDEVVTSGNFLVSAESRLRGAL